ncbi:hypothetical protein SLS61_004602 [Didymella pomorum]
MGRGAYDLTDPSKYKSAAASDVLNWEDDARRVREAAAAEGAAAELEIKLDRSKKSRAFKKRGHVEEGPQRQAPRWLFGLSAAKGTNQK